MSKQSSGRRRKVAVVTGTRAEYGLLRSPMEAIRRHRKLRLQVIATGMHLLGKFGHTVNGILADGFPVDARIGMQKGDDSAVDQAVGLSRGIGGIARFLDEAGTDVVVVLGDRIEAMAGALAAVTTGKILAHIHGGDVAAGDFDDSLRHAITKLAHVHCTATRQSARRVIGLGESPDRVFTTGAPGLVRIIELAAEANVSRRRSGRALIVHHAMGRSAVRERRAMEAVLRAVEAAGLARTIIYPNSDRGHTGIIEAIEAHRRAGRGDDVRIERSLDRDSYLRVLIEADVLVGNSSSGVIEASTAGTPAVNVGLRQEGRQPSGPSVVQAGESVEEIADGLKRALRKRPRIGGLGVYGDGRAGVRIADVLADIPLSEAYGRKPPLTPTGRANV